MKEKYKFISSFLYTLSPYLNNIFLLSLQNHCSCLNLFLYPNYQVRTNFVTLFHILRYWVKLLHRLVNKFSKFQIFIHRKNIFLIFLLIIYGLRLLLIQKKLLLWIKNQSNYLFFLLLGVQLRLACTVVYFIVVEQ